MREQNWSLDKSKFLNEAEVADIRQSAEMLYLLGKENLRIRPMMDGFLIELGLWAGLRVAEMVALTVGDLRMSGPAPFVLVQNGKGGKSRKVRISEKFRETCLDLLAFREELGLSPELDAPIFWGSRTTRSLQKSFKRTARRAGLDPIFSIHCLRHTYGSFLYQASGHNLRLVQQQLGHSSVTITEVYTHILSDHFAEAVEWMYGEETPKMKGTKK